MTDLDNTEDSGERIGDWYLARRLLGYLKRYKWHVLCSVALTMLSTPLVLARPPLTKAAVDLFLTPDPSRPPSQFELLLKRCADTTGLGDSAYNGIVFVTLLLLLANIGALVTRYAQLVVTEILGQKIVYDLREEVFGHLQRLSVQFYDRTPAGRLITRLTSDIDSLNEVFTSKIITMLGDVAMALYIVIWMFQVNWRLMLVSFAVLPVLASLAAWFRLRTRLAFQAVRVWIANINAFLHEHITGMQVVQLFGRELKESEQFAEINKAYWKANIDTNFYYALLFPAVEVMMSVGLALIIWYGGGQVIREAASLGTLIAFIQLAQAFYSPILQISDKYNVFQAALASCERIFKLLDEPVTVKSCDEPVPLKNAQGRLEFCNVWFAYKANVWVLRDVSFVVEPGQRVAFVGHTGAGKTTITSLLLRLYDIQRGQILFDGVDIRELDVQELRSKFSIMLQDVFLFSGDIAFNIRLGNQAITDEMVKSAAREVHADDFIMKLQNGYQSELREQGAGLSVGQKQLIGLARALAFDSCVLVLDEATSSIDTETELLIRDAIERLMTGRTSLIIAHRLSTIQAVDKILVMHKGEIREVGDHQSLLAQRGLYWRLYQLQFSDDQKRTGVGTVADD